jgi:hypothetical protein
MISSSVSLSPASWPFKRRTIAAAKNCEATSENPNARKVSTIFCRFQRNPLFFYGRILHGLRNSMEAANNLFNAVDPIFPHSYASVRRLGIVEGRISGKDGSACRLDYS